MTHMTLQAVRQLIANDAYAITFQSVQQYRATLLRHVDNLVDGVQQHASGGTVWEDLLLVGEGLQPLCVEATKEAQTGVTLDEALYALDLVVNKMHVQGLSGQRAFALDVLKRAEAATVEFSNAGREPDRNGCAAAELAQQTAAPGTLRDTYKNGPEGMPRVERMPNAVLECLISHSLFRYLGGGLEGDDRDQLYSLMHDTANEVLARLPSWPSALSKPEAPKLAYGHRDGFYLLANARRLGMEPISRVRNMPNWVLAKELFATGSTSAHQICRDADIDPEGFKVHRAATFDGGQGEGQ